MRLASNSIKQKEISRTTLQLHRLHDNDESEDECSVHIIISAVKYNDVKKNVPSESLEAGTSRHLQY